jgi:hypothetical protein
MLWVVLIPLMLFGIAVATLPIVAVTLLEERERRSARSPAAVAVDRAEPTPEHVAAEAA